MGERERKLHGETTTKWKGAERAKLGCTRGAFRLVRKDSGPKDEGGREKRLTL